MFQATNQWLSIVAVLHMCLLMNSNISIQGLCQEMVDFPKMYGHVCRENNADKAPSLVMTNIIAIENGHL